MLQSEEGFQVSILCPLSQLLWTIETIETITRDHIMERDRYISYHTALLLAGQNNADGSLFALSESFSVLHTLLPL